MANDVKNNGDFWDISTLVNKKDPTPSTFSPAVRLATVTDGEKSLADDKNRLTLKPQSVTDDSTDKKVSQDERSPSSAFIYTPEDNSLIKEVRITDEHGGYNFYATFKTDALELFECEGSECPYAPYFSYVPQYVQLTPAQKSYYLWWRTCLRRGENIKSDYSYFWLYVYEIINLPDIIPPKEGIKMLCRIWRDYRATLPNIDKNMMIWMCDYCLLHGLACPREEIADFLPLVIEESEFKEFYLGERVFDEVNVDYIVSVASDYNWHKSKILKNEKSNELFSRHMNAALRLPISLLFDRGHMSISKENTRTLSYSAFRRSLCGYFNRKHIEIEYYSLSHTPSIRALLTMAVKYAENKLRSMLSVKSRLAIIGLPDEYKTAIDVYFSSLPENNAAKTQSRPEYEKLYDALDNNISFGDAMEIEHSSWETARILTVEEEGSVPAFTEGEASDPLQLTAITERAAPADSTVTPTQSHTPDTAADMPSDCYGLSCEYIGFISALLDNDRQGMAEISRSLGKSEEGVAEYINEKFSDSFGDIIIEITENGCEILPDYIEELTQWLNR